MTCYVPCPYCDGTGKLKHTCDRRDLKLLKLIWEFEGYPRHESLGIYRCRICGQLWKIRFQWDDGTGRDDIWLRPGESKRGYTFTHQEAEEVLSND